MAIIAGIHRIIFVLFFFFFRMTGKLNFLKIERLKRPKFSYNLLLFF